MSAKRSAVIACALMFSLAGCQKGQQPAASANKPSPPPTEIWVSETTGKEYRVHVENDAVHIEWLNISPELAQHGAYIRSECKKQGDKWVGSSSLYLPCTTESGAKPKFENWCHLNTPFEIDSMTPQSITGQSPTLGKFDCSKCQILESQMKGFLWSPKEATPPMSNPAPASQ